MAKQQKNKEVAYPVTSFQGKISVALFGMLKRIIIQSDLTNKEFLGIVVDMIQQNPEIWDKHVEYYKENKN